MKAIKIFSLIFVLCINMGQMRAQSLADYRKEYNKKLFDVEFMHNYALALKKSPNRDEKEYQQIANNYALISSFYFFLKINKEATNSKESIPTIDITAVKKAKLPLTILHQAEVDFIIAYQKGNYKKQRNIVKEILAQEMPKDNMCDIAIVANILNSLIEQGSLQDSKDYLAFLKEYATNPTNKDMNLQVNSTIENCEGYIMLKEFENNENNK